MTPRLDRIVTCLHVVLVSSLDLYIPFFLERFVSNSLYPTNVLMRIFAVLGLSYWRLYGDQGPICRSRLEPHHAATQPNMTGVGFHQEP